MISPMLSKAVEQLPGGNAFLYEIKLDGQRTVAEVSSKKLLLSTRGFQNVTAGYPELEELRECFDGKDAVFDGEIVALEKGIPSFQLLQQRMNLRDARALKPLLETIPVVYYVFDLLHYNGRSLFRTPLIDRKSLLQRILVNGKHVKLLPFFDSKERILEQAKKFGYEGVVAKRRDSFYMPGQRTSLWVKQKFHLIDSFVIGGWLEGKRSYNFASLLAGKYRNKQLIYCGRVGTGYDERTLMRLFSRLEELKTDKSPFQRLPRMTEKKHFVKPALVAEVKFKEWTAAGILRAPVFLGLRYDIKPTQCVF
jgi:bifunctional non-homologous end joining protein LigD